MTMPDERMRSLRWGCELLGELVLDTTQRAHRANREPAMPPILFLDYDGVLHPDDVYLERGRPVLRATGQLLTRARDGPLKRARELASLRACRPWPAC